MHVASALVVLRRFEPLVALIERRFQATGRSNDDVEAVFHENDDDASPTVGERQRREQPAILQRTLALFYPNIVVDDLKRQAAAAKSAAATPPPPISLQQPYHPASPRFAHSSIV